MMRVAATWFLVLALAGVAATATPDAVAKLGLVRAHVAAEPWRLWSGHFVHLTISHLLVDLGGIVLGLLGRPATTWSGPGIDVGVGCGLTGAALLVVHPDVHWYVGLSGVVHVLWGAALAERVALDLGRSWAAPLLLVVVAKVAWQSATGHAPGQLDLPVVPEAHAWGLGAGVGLGLVRGLHRRRSAAS